MQIQNSITLTPTHRLIVIVLIVLQYLLFLFSQILMTHFNTIAFPFIPYDSLTLKNKHNSHYLWNFSLYFLFWAQHIVMATLKYKNAWLKKWDYFPLYQRYIYNVLSGLCLWFIFANVKPSYGYIFSIPLWICIPLILLGVILLGLGIIALGDKIFNPFKLGDIFNSKQLTYVPYNVENIDNLKTNGIYSLVRHPIQGGFLLIIIFGNGVYTIDRAIFAIGFSTFILIGVIME